MLHRAIPNLCVLLLLVFSRADVDAPRLSHSFEGQRDHPENIISNTMMNFNPFKRVTKKEEEPANTAEVFRVVIPENVRPGELFQTYAGSRIVLVRCPQDGYPGKVLSITVRNQNEGEHTEQQQRQQSPPPQPPPAPPVQRPPPKQQQLFEVEVPRGVQPGQPFSLLAGGQRILVTCPLNARPGSRIRFNVPILPRTETDNEAAKIRMTYQNKDGWARTIRVNDMRFQWIRMDDKGDIDLNQRFDVDRSAYVRKLEYHPSQEGRIRSGTLRLVPAADAAVDSCIKGPNGRVLVSYTEIADAQVLAFEQKAEWFHEICSKYLKVPWNAGHMAINVRRDSLVVDSLNAILTMNRNDMRKYWRFNFLGEEAIDAGGVTRHWFQQVTEDLFNADMGLWQSSAVNQMCMQINPASGMLIHVDSILYCTCRAVPFLISFYFCSILL